MRQNNQLCNGKEGGYYALFSVILCPLHSVTNEEQYEKCLQLLQKIQVISIIANTATGKPYLTITKQYLASSVKRTGTQGKTKVSMYCMTAVGLSMVKLCLAGGIS